MPLPTCIGLLALVLAQPATRPADDLAALSDEFDSPATKSRWQTVNQVERWNADQLRVFDISGQVKGKLLLVPYTSVWFRDYRGVMLFKPVTGDFVVTTDLRVTRPDGNGAPGSQYSLCGLMIRAPRDITPASWRPGGENYVFLSIGSADQPGVFQTEVKTTRNSDSQLQISPGTESASLRIARIGDAMLLFRKPQGGEWTVHRRYRREDFPQTLQVGLTTYTDWETCSRMDPQQHNRTVIRTGNPQVRAEVDYIRYARPTLPESLRSKDLTDPGQVSDAELLQAFAN
jgi:hypothetical protein